jgi:hypothetical protein
MATKMTITTASKQQNIFFPISLYGKMNIF